MSARCRNCVNPIERIEYQGWRHTYPHDVVTTYCPLSMERDQILTVARPEGEDQ